MLVQQSQGMQQVRKQEKFQTHCIKTAAKIPQKGSTQSQKE